MILEFFHTWYMKLERVVVGEQQIVDLSPVLFLFSILIWFLIFSLAFFLSFELWLNWLSFAVLHCCVFYVWSDFKWSNYERLILCLISWLTIFFKVVQFISLLFTLFRINKLVLIIWQSCKISLNWYFVLNRLNQSLHRQ